MSKILTFIKWFVITIPLGLVALLTAPIFYPLWDLTHWKIFWIWNDDSRFNEDGTPKGDYSVYIDKYGDGEETFKVRYKWHVRNRMWNLRDWISNYKKGDGSGLTEKEFIIDNITLNGEKVQDGGKWPMICGLKYKVNEGQDPWQGWVGDEIDFKYSIIGKSFMWYKQDSILSFRYSQCKIVTYLLFWKRWRTIKIASSKNDTTFSFKYQKLTN
jgi:hypothetical protein